MAEQDLNAIAFPTFDEAQMARIEKYASGTPKKFQAGQALFHVGDRDVEFFVIKSGEVENGTIAGAGNVSVINSSGALTLNGAVPNLIIAGGTVTGFNASITNLTWSSGVLQGTNA